MKPGHLIPGPGLPFSGPQCGFIRDLTERVVIQRLAEVEARYEAKLAQVRSELLLLKPGLIGRVPPDGFLPLKTVAIDTGFSQSYIRKMIAEDKIEAVKVGGRVFVRPPDRQG